MLGDCLGSSIKDTMASQGHAKTLTDVFGVQVSGIEEVTATRTAAGHLEVYCINILIPTSIAKHKQNLASLDIVAAVDVAVVDAVAAVMETVTAEPA